MFMRTRKLVKKLFSLMSVSKQETKERDLSVFLGWFGHTFKSNVHIFLGDDTINISCLQNFTNPFSVIPLDVCRKSQKNDCQEYRPGQ